MSDFNVPSNLDADGIKQNLIEHMQKQDDFSGYDFEGSALATVIDLLTHNTNILAHIAHIGMTEQFIDTAQIRRNIVSEAKKLGYIPHSKTASVAIVNIVVKPTGDDIPSSITLRKGDKFVSAKDDEAFYFVVTQNVQATLFNGEYRFENVHLTQGEYRTNRYDISTTGQKIVIRNPNVDTSTLSVNVRESKNAAINNLYSIRNSLVNLDENSKVCFVSENKDGNYQIEFGNGKTGKQIKTGNYVEINYIHTKGITGNGCRIFKSVNSVGGFNNVQVELIQKSFGGSERENEEDIRFIAPKHFMAAERAVIPSDYSALVRANLYGVKDVNSWGGEDNIPPAYGQVFVSIKMQDGQQLSDTIKKYVSREILKKYNVLTIVPVIVDPQDVYLGVDVVVSVNYNKLDIDDSLLEQMIKDRSLEYGNLTLGKFDSKFRTSKYLAEIDSIHPAITNSYIRGLTMTKEPYVEVGKPQSLAINFVNNKLRKGSLRIDGFRVLDSTTSQILGNVYYMQDNEQGEISIFRDEDGKQVMVHRGIGSINYDTGSITIRDFTPVTTSIYNEIRVVVSADSQVINSFNNDIINIVDTAHINVEIERE